MHPIKRLLPLSLLIATAAAAQTPHSRDKVKPKSEEQTQLESVNAKLTQVEQAMTEMKQQLEQARKDAAEAQDRASQAMRQATSFQSSVDANGQAVTALSNAVTDIKDNTKAIVQTIQDDQLHTKVAIEHPESLRFKGITLSLTGSFLAGETVFRNHATGGDLPTAWTSIPLPASDLAQASEFFGSGRQSRIALLAESKGDPLSMRGYYEADFLGSGTTSNNNQSNSYVLRQRQLWAQLETKSGWTFSGGQMWSLATEYKNGLTLRQENTPMTIDPNYVPGFVWARQYGFRVTHQLSPRLWTAISLENPQTLSPVINGDTTGLPLILWASPGANGGAYNAAANTSNGTTSGLLTSYSMNAIPDMLAKIAYEPKSGGHYELFGMSRFFRARLYPNATAAEIKAGTATSAGAYNDTEAGEGIGGSVRIPILHKRVDVGAKGLWGTGVGRYGDSTIADVTARANGRLMPLHAFSALSTVEWHATPRFDIYANYGEDDVQRTSHANLSTGKPLGYGVGLNNSGCSTEPIPTGSGGATSYPNTPSNCSAVNRDVQEVTGGYWFDLYRGPRGRIRQGLEYGYAMRKTWDDSKGIAPSGNDNIVLTSFRYYLP